MSIANPDFHIYFFLRRFAVLAEIIFLTECLTYLKNSAIIQRKKGADGKSNPCGRYQRERRYAVSLFTEPRVKTTPEPQAVTSPAVFLALRDGAKLLLR